MPAEMPTQDIATPDSDWNLVRHRLGQVRAHAGRGLILHRAAKGPPGKKDGPGGPGDEDGKTGLITKTRPVTKKPHLYKVLLLNDDYTPMEFVTHILERFFNKSREDATRIMYHVHQKGVGVCGVYTFEVAETKIAQVMDFARQHQHPLQCRMEKE
jgi:ATP-dependent Clp protease adaptor protein ClpS